MKNIVKSFSLLTPDECKRAVEKIDQMREAWQPLEGKPGVPELHVLPTALSLRKNQHELYRSEFQRMNPLMQDRFFDIYQKIQQEFEKILQQPVKLSHEASAPGFRIFQGPANAGAIQFDMDHMFYGWQGRHEYDMASPLSFTLALELPQSGAGLNVWNLRAEDARPADLEKVVATEPNYVSYEVGHLYYKQALYLNQVTHRPDVKPNERRITMQGYGLKHHSGHWSLFL